MPYSDLPPDAFWRLCLEDDAHHLGALYRPKFSLVPGQRVSTAGSCFAQYFRARVEASDLDFVDVEPAPKQMEEVTAKTFGYGMFSARFGNIYTARQLLQLVQDSVVGHLRPNAMWEQGGRWYDGLRPNVEPNGLHSRDELELHRLQHLHRVVDMFRKTDVFAFTLGLTEAWVDTRCGTVFPVAPGTIAGSFDPERHAFVNFGIADVIEDLNTLVHVLRTINPDIRIILTVSPVPLTATRSGQHVIRATTYSKSVLRVAADEICQLYDFVDYFPSYEVVTAPMFKGQFYQPNMRSVTEEGVQSVMSLFFMAHPNLSMTFGAGLPKADAGQTDSDDDLVCEEVLLEEFARK